MKKAIQIVCVAVVVGLGSSAMAGLAGSALQFGDDTQIAVVPNHPSLNPTPALTIEAWFMLTVPEVPAGYSPVIEKPYTSHSAPFYQYSLGPGSAFKFRGMVATTGPETKYAYGDLSSAVGVWHHFAATYDGGYLRIYGDGVLEETHAISGTMQTFDAPLTFGKHLNYPAAIRGVIDEVRVWAVARTTTEIAENYNRIIAPETTGLVGYWNFDETDGQVVYDQTDYDNHGILGLTDLIESDDPLRVLSGAPLVPEPATVTLLSVGGFVLLRRRKRKDPKPESGGCEL